MMCDLKNYIMRREIKTEEFVKKSRQHEDEAILNAVCFVGGAVSQIIVVI